MKYGVMAVLLAGLIALAGCGGGDKKAANRDKDSTVAAGTGTLPAELIAKEAPAGAKNVLEAKKDAKEGDEIVMRARVGGRKEGVFTDGRAQMMVMDVSLPNCSDNPNDTCKTPWDYCCEPQEKITEHAATVQVVGADGKVLPVSLKGQSSIDHGSYIVVKGKVGKRDGGNLLINATSIYVEPAKPKG
jgi:hypothetical protein